LLHPPVLDDFGLASAVRWYVEGFAQRSGINVKLDLAEEFPRFGRELETAVFRIVQEGLTNVHRHSGAKKSSVGLLVKDHFICATITDDGRGMAPDVLDDVKEGRGGVGLLGMRERVKKLGGTISIDSGAAGTTITAELPSGGRVEAIGS
jgi:two-component system, NarL family, sensor kinase